MKRRDMADECKALLLLAREPEQRDKNARRKADTLMGKLARRVRDSGADSRLVRSCVRNGEDWIYYVDEPGKHGFYTKNDMSWSMVPRGAGFWDGVADIVVWFEKYLMREKIWARKPKRRKGSDA